MFTVVDLSSYTILNQPHELGAGKMDKVNSQKNLTMKFNSLYFFIDFNTKQSP